MVTAWSFKQNDCIKAVDEFSLCRLLPLVAEKAAMCDEMGCDPSIYTIDHPDLTYQTLWKTPLVYKGNTVASWTGSLTSMNCYSGVIS